MWNVSCTLVHQGFHVLMCTDKYTNKHKRGCVCVSVDGSFPVMCVCVS